MRSIGARTKIAVCGTVVGGALLFTAGSVAQAEPTPPPPGPDGLINVLVGGVMYLDSVPTSQAAQAITEMCALPGPAASAMVAQVDAAGVSQTVCTGESSGDVVLAQNLPAGQEVSPVVPGMDSQNELGPAEDTPAGGGQIEDSLPDEPDNMPAMN
jgi:hypothetical protein